MLPVVTLAGSARAQGLAHGEALRASIAHNLAVYFERFEREGRLSRPEVLRRAGSYWAAMRAQSGEYAAALEGVAEGSGLDLLELVALNVRYEILYHQFTVNALADGCTAFGALPEATADGHTLLGQNWDWIPEVEGAVLRLASDADRHDGTRPPVLCFTEAGIVGGKIGLNAAGLGLAINGLTSTGDDWSGRHKPFHVRCHEVLAQRDLAAAAAVVADGRRACSANFLLGHRLQGLVDLESAPGAVCRREPRAGTMAHTNHFLDPERIGVTEPPNPRLPGSQNRLEQMRRLLAEGRPLSPATLRTALRDHVGHPNSVCRHPAPDDPPERRYETVVSVVMDLDTCEMWISDGPPCRSEYQHVTLNGGSA